MLLVNLLLGLQETPGVEASLRTNSYSVPWRLFDPDFETKLISPPPACPYSALKPFVSTANSVIASSEGVFTDTQELDNARVVLAEMPSRLTPKLAACPPPIWKLLSPKFFDSGARIARSKGLRRAPPTTVGKILDQLVRDNGRTLRVFVCS